MKMEDWIKAKMEKYRDRFEGRLDETQLDWLAAGLEAAWNMGKINGQTEAFEEWQKQWEKQ
ncbi:hypothetical protein MKZ21_30625 [Paenibacillus sp. FSL P2-0536]|uniref:hypothetical protein n=1 Tax=Paenibacillus sp. FSL P2-0536 TaxID=2921629 RepID=UPI0030F884B0